MTTEIRARVGKGFFHEVFGGKSFIHCVVEAGIKNPRDWGATRIRLHTQDDTRFTIIDNGDGLSAVNREAFLSVNRSSATNAKQSGRFGTGTKQFLFSHASSVRVRTAPREEPDLVYIFEFTTEGYEDLAFTNGKLKPRVVKKTPQTWPHMHQEDGVWHDTFGTEISYQLARPKSSAIYRGERLAKKLSDRLSRKFQHIVSVDNLNELPPKEMIGQPFNTAKVIPVLGLVDIDVYRPKTRRGEDGLRLTSHEVGEATMNSFMLAISGIRSISLDKIYAHPEVCGTISAEYLADYATETRDAINPSVADDRRTILLIRHLNIIAPAVASALKIFRDTDKGNDEQFIDEVIAHVNRRYLPEGEMPPHTPGEPEHEDTGNDDDDDDRPPGQPQGEVLRILLDPEYEIGQKLTARVSIRKDLRTTYKATDVQWHYEQSRCRNVQCNDDGTLSLTAYEDGVGWITAEIPGTSYHSLRRYTIVRSRVFILYPVVLKTTVGKTHTIAAVNVDKLSGPPKWSHEGVGQMTSGPRLARFTATRPGTAQITARDPNNPERYSTCQIQVTAHEVGRRMRIRDIWYDVEFGAYGTDQFDRPAVIMDHQPMRGLFINTAAPGYEEERKRGRLKDFVLQAIALEHARFDYFNARRAHRSGTTLNAEQFEKLTEDICCEGFRVYREMLRDT